jgi:hypothetical protein
MSRPARAVRALRLQPGAEGPRRGGIANGRHRRREPGRAPTDAAPAPRIAAPPIAALHRIAGEYECELTAGAARCMDGQCCGARRIRLRHRDRPLDPMRANLVGISLRVNPARPPTCRWRTTIPGARATAARRGARALKPLLEDPARASSASTASTTCTCCAPRHRCAGLCRRHDAGKLRAELHRRAPRHGFAGEERLPRLRHRPLRGCGRQGREADRLPAGRAGRCHPLRRRGRRHHPAPAPRAVAASCRPSRRCVRCTATSRCRWCRCWRASKPTAC